MTAAANKSQSGSSGESDLSDSSDSAAPPRPPRLSSYLLLNIAVWSFLVLQALLLTALLGSPRMVVLISILLALGFTAVSIFDYVYLRSTRR